jgi:chromate transport protein ChrA
VALGPYARLCVPDPPQHRHRRTGNSVMSPATPAATELVERRRWISEQRFLHALNDCMLLPGPEAQQLAAYVGWLMHRSGGGIVAGALFVLPSLFIPIALSWIYLRFGDAPWWPASSSA